MGVISNSNRGRGVAYRFWLRVEQERVARGWTKIQLWQAVKDRSGDGPSPARSTIDNLSDSTRAPQPRIVRALADALDNDWGEAQELAGLVPSTTSPSADVRDAIERSEAYNEQEKAAILGLLDVLDAGRETRRRGQDSGGPMNGTAGQGGR